MMRQPTNTRNYVASNTQHQPLAGKDSAGVTKTLAESERRQLHPSLLRREGLVKMWSSLWKGRRRDSKIFNIKEQDLCIITTIYIS